SGVRLGPYEIQSFLSRGGMGEVYRARDTRLNRAVAIKILPKEACSDPNRLSRFEGEARSASALNHQNIITIYDIGMHDSGPFIAMEFVEGKTLREILSSGALPFKTLIDIAAQLSEGLASAHEAGIVHRDLKPENIIVNKNGVVKILDFGLAKLCEIGITAENASQFATAGPQTASGLIVGTIGYMSPEQASGKSVDFRSDQFSFATILYEMAAGRSPFLRATAAETLTAIIREDAEPMELFNPNLPPSFLWLVRRCLSKEPAARYASTRDLARDLRDLKEHLAAPGARSSQSATSIAAQPHKKRYVPIAIMVLVLISLLIGSFWFIKSRRPATSSDAVLAPSIAVLPFTAFGKQMQEEYFSDGMTEALITELAKIPGMQVIARNSVFQYKGQNVNVPQVGKELAVNYVLEGSVQRSGNRIRVHAQLINVRTGYHLWAERYDRSTADVFAVQDDISEKIASALRLTLTKAAPKRPTKNLQAYDYYLQGKYFSNMRYEDDVNQAIPLLEKAIALDPQFALAHA
ncbi:MAG TPA: protein kinase, partial [Acidobacteriota bacterium]|nr:protein kinase [Acidobacteriota bacterium]